MVRGQTRILNIYMAKKVIYFDKFCDFSVTAVTENGKLTDCRFNAEDGSPAVGDIYRGRVVNVLEGMQAAFVDCGLERNCYLSEGDLAYGTEGGVSALKAGDEIMVQITKIPSGKKGAKVTQRISIVGKTLIYLPDTDFVGISHRIEDDELRESLIFAAKNTKKKNEGLVIRNSAPFCKYDQISAELKFLRKIYERTAEAYKSATAPSLVFSDFSMPVRVMRDFTEHDVSKIVTGSAEQHDEIADLLKIMPGGKKIKLELYSGMRGMLDEAGIIDQIIETCSPRVELGNGAYLVIERTEALTSIDVNTGGFIGDDSLEYTVYQTNLAAAREIARQIKLRGIGGLFVVDFIDMAEPAHRKALCDELEKALKKDRAPYKVLAMSDFGLVEFTRKRSGAELSSFVLKPCPVCGRGEDFSDDFYAVLVQSEALKALSDGAETVCIELRPEAAAALAKKVGLGDSIRAKFPSAEVCLIPDDSKKSREIGCRRGKRGYIPKEKAIKI